MVINELPQRLKSIPASRTCWCDSSAFQPAAHPEYVVCSGCGNAIYIGVLSDDIALLPKLEELYSQEYWQSHQVQRGAPTLERRSRIDLSGRCAYWLEHLLKFIAPPANVLELGSSHGGFLKLMNMTGFNSTGMEIDEKIVHESAARFGAQVLKGTLEEHQWTIGKFKAVIMMDVLEHLLDPVKTLQGVLDVMEPDGVLVVQMPEFKREYPADWMMYLPAEHTFLHTKESAKRLCAKVGLPHVHFLPPYFPDHDMFFVAARTAIKERSQEEIVGDLLASPNGRVILAIFDARSLPQPIHRGVRAALSTLKIAVIDFAKRKIG